MVLRLDRCHPCLLLTRHRQEAAPTSENEHLIAPRYFPKATRTVAHDPFLPRCKTTEPSCVQATHRTIPPPRATGATPLLPAIRTGFDNCATNTSFDTDSASNEHRDDQQHSGSKSNRSTPENSNTNPLATLSLQSRPPDASLPGFHASRPVAVGHTHHFRHITESNKDENSPRNKSGGVKHTTVVLFRPEIAAEHR